MASELKYGTYSQYEVLSLRRIKDNYQVYKFKFDNGYGASVVKFEGTMGFDNDKYELAVIKFTDGDNFHLVYDTPIASDIVGHLSNAEVLDYLERIKNL